MVAALIVFNQGGPGTPGEAFIGNSGAVVTVTNDDNTDVTSWSIELLDVPSDSALSPVVLGSAVNNTPTANFTPDVPGSYRILLTVSDGVGINEDIRNFGVRDARGIIFPPYQKFPDPLPLTGTGTPQDKPDELNFNGVSRGWAGDPSLGLLEMFFRTYDDLPRRDVSTVSAALAASDPPLVVVDLDAAGASSTVTLPPTPRVNQLVRILATGSVLDRVVTVQAAGGGTIVPYGTLDIMPQGSGVFIHEGSNIWRALGVLGSPEVNRDFFNWRVTTSNANIVLTSVPGRVNLHKADVSGGSHTVSLSATPTTGDRVLVKDTGSAGTNAITISGNGNLIDGAASIAISLDYGSFQFFFDGTGWLVI